MTPTTEGAQPELQGDAALLDRVVLDAAQIARAITRIAHEIVERTRGAQDLVLLGIPTRGVPLAARLGSAINEITAATDPAGLHHPVNVGALDVTMYRDDLRMRPARALLPTSLPASGIDDKLVVLVDDVLFSGRTIRAALDALGDSGRPRSVSWPYLSTEGTGNSRSGRTTSAKTFRPRALSRCTCLLWNTTASMSYGWRDFNDTSPVVGCGSLPRRCGSGSRHSC